MCPCTHTFWIDIFKILLSFLFVSFKLLEVFFFFLMVMVGFCGLFCLFICFAFLCVWVSACFFCSVVLVSLIVLEEEKKDEVGWVGNGRNLGRVERGERI